MQYGSICSGIEAATAAWHSLGWNPVFFSEIETFPKKVLAHHYPNVPCHGDFTTIGASDYGAIDLLVGGTPCQAFSVAGLRKGFADERGNLTLEFIRLAERLHPKWLVWENVPGVLSQDNGRAFGAFLGGLAECGYGFAYRILDAQYFGVPQRRRRVFVIGYLGDWRPPAAVLFEQESLCGDITPERETGKDVAGTFTSRTKSGGWGTDVDLAAGNYMQPWPADVAPTLDANYGDKQGMNNQHIGGQDCTLPELSLCLNAGAMGRIDAESETLIPTSGGCFGEAVAFAQNTRDEVRLIGGDGSIAGALAAETGMKQQTYLAYGIQSNIIGRQDHNGGNGMGVCEEQSPTLTKADQHGVVTAFKIREGCEGGGKGYLGQDECAFTLSTHQDQQIKNGMQVRRLTPRECERLQGFTDDYTKINDKTPDGSRYKALGNSMAVPVMKWLGERIQMVEQQRTKG